MPEDDDPIEQIKQLIRAVVGPGQTAALDQITGLREEFDGLITRTEAVVDAGLRLAAGAEAATDARSHDIDEMARHLEGVDRMLGGMVSMFGHTVDVVTRLDARLSIVEGAAISFMALASLESLDAAKVRELLSSFGRSYRLVRKDLTDLSVVERQRELQKIADDGVTAMLDIVDEAPDKKN